LPGVVGDHQQHAVKVERVSHVDSRNQVANMRRVKRATEKSDPFWHG
jgi:hypothetical protein